jgi:hypothetical protein
VQKNLSDRAHIRGGPPCVFFGPGDGFGQAHELAFLDHDFGHHLRAVLGQARSSVGGIRFVASDNYFGCDCSMLETLYQAIFHDPSL